MSFIYLASPYTDKSTKIMYDRYRKATLATGQLLKDKHFVYSPIVHCHQLAQDTDLPVSASFWWNYNKAMLECASELWLLTLDGWKSSSGMHKEAKWAIIHELPIKYIQYSELFKSVS